MSAINQLAQVTQKIAEATAMISQLQALIPALALAAGAEASGTETPAPKVKKAKKVKAPAAAAASPAEVVAKPKKPASDGTMAWHAFVKNVQETQPTRFAELKKHSDVLHEAKSIREEDEAGYKSFVSSWKAAHLAASETPLETIVEEVVTAPAATSPAPAAAAEVVEVSVAEPKEKEKRKVAVGTMAWHAFVTHCKATMPELATLSKSSEKLQAIKARKQNDKTGYDSFVAEWKAAQPVA
jgi:deoxyribodipyrimidine photolyase